MLAHVGDSAGRYGMAHSVPDSCQNERGTKVNSGQSRATGRASAGQGAELTRSCGKRPLL